MPFHSINFYHLTFNYRWLHCSTIWNRFRQSLWAVSENLIRNAHRHDQWFLFFLPKARVAKISGKLVANWTVDPRSNPELKRKPTFWAAGVSLVVGHVGDVGLILHGRVHLGLHFGTNLGSIGILHSFVSSVEIVSIINSFANKDWKSVWKWKRAISCFSANPLRRSCVCRGESPSTDCRGLRLPSHRAHRDLSLAGMVAEWGERFKERYHAYICVCVHTCAWVLCGPSRWIHSVLWW